MWSKDLVNYQSSGEAASDGTVAIITQTPTDLSLSSTNDDAISENTREVSTEVIEGEASAIYIKMVVTNTAIVSWGSEPALGGDLIF